MRHDAIAVGESTHDAIGRRLVLTTLAHASNGDRDLLKQWAKHLLEIRGSDNSVYDKSKRAIEVSINSKAIWPFVKMVSSELKRMGWDERGIPARMALAVAAPSALFLSSQGAGIAALGGAIGVPLWIVFGAGSAFAGVIIEEIDRV